MKKPRSVVRQNRGSKLDIEEDRLGSFLFFFLLSGTVAGLLEGLDEGFNLHCFSGGNHRFGIGASFWSDAHFRDSFDSLKCNLHFF